MMKDIKLWVVTHQHFELVYYNVTICILNNILYVNLPKMWDNRFTLNEYEIN